jgi:signal transduction histidine kinase
LVGSSIRKIFADSVEADAILRELLEKKRMYESREINLISQSAKIIPIGFTTTILSANDPDYNGVIISFRDLTNLQYYRVQMERIDRLATLGEVSAGIAHEIRNPLAGIKTSAQLLEESFSPGDFRSQLVSRIVKEIDRSNELLKKFFNFAKPGKPKQEFVSLESLIEGVFLLLSSKIRKKNIDFIRHYDSEVPDVYVDENQMEQILINLFLNALDAMDKDGKMTVHLKTMPNTYASIRNDVTHVAFVQIEDNGCGIKEENIEKIFNPFFTTKDDGVGLGLSISSRLIEENGGTVLVQSRWGEGTCFTLILPID